MRLTAVLLTLLVIFGFVSVNAQEMTQTPLPDVGSTFDDVTFDNVITAPDMYYDTHVTLTGVVETVISPQLFVLSNATQQGTGQILVVNNSGRDFDASLTQGQQITITGTLRPSVNALNNDGMLVTDFDVRNTVAPNILEQYPAATVLEASSFNDFGVDRGDAALTETSLEELTARTDEFYGRQVSFEGVIESLANVKILIVGEGAIIDNDQVLVVNRTDQEFDLAFGEGARIYVTGMVQPSIQEQEDGVFTVTDVTPSALTPQPDTNAVIEATQEAQVGITGEPFSLQSLLNESQLDQYRHFTIVEVTSLDDLMLVGSLGEITTSANQFYDRSLMVQGTVETLVSNNTFVLNESGLLSNNRVLVVNPPHVDFANVLEGEQIRVFGTVRPYDLPMLQQDLNTTIDETVFADYQDYTVMLADRIVLVP